MKDAVEDAEHQRNNRISLGVAAGAVLAYVFFGNFRNFSG